MCQPLNSKPLSVDKSNSNLIGVPDLSFTISVSVRHEGNYVSGCFAGGRRKQHCGLLPYCMKTLSKYLLSVPTCFKNRIQSHGQLLLWRRFLLFLPSRRERRALVANLPGSSTGGRHTLFSRGIILTKTLLLSKARAEGRDRACEFGGRRKQLGRVLVCAPLLPARMGACQDAGGEQPEAGGGQAESGRELLALL